MGVKGEGSCEGKEKTQARRERLGENQRPEEDEEPEGGFPKSGVQMRGPD